MLLFVTIRNATRNDRHTPFYGVPYNHRMTRHSLTNNLNNFDAMPYLWKLQVCIRKYILLIDFINFDTLPSPYDFNYIAAVIILTRIHNFVCCTSWKYHRLLDCKVSSYTTMTWVIETSVLISHCIEWNEAPRLNLFSSTFHTVKDTDTRWKVCFGPTRSRLA